MQVFVGIDDLGSMGPLTKPFLYENPLGPLNLEIARAADESAVFEQLGLDYLHLRACIDHEDASGTRHSNGVRPNDQWTWSRERREFSADFDFNLAAMVAIHRRDTKALLAAALPQLRQLAVQTAAQVAVELEADPSRITAFTAAFPGVAVSLLPRRVPARRRRRGQSAIVEIEVQHEGGSTSEVLDRRAAIREQLEMALHEQRLGLFEGSSSGEFHYEFTFRVSSAQRAIDLLGVVFESAGVDASRVRFDVTESDD